ncbi:hypothetical protein VIGAN_11082200, partial [Vigna angularis var. angularis]
SCERNCSFHSTKQRLFTAILKRKPAGVNRTPDMHLFSKQWQRVQTHWIHQSKKTINQIHNIEEEAFSIPSS